MASDLYLLFGRAFFVEEEGGGQRGTGILFHCVIPEKKVLLLGPSFGNTGQEAGMVDHLFLWAPLRCLLKFIKWLFIHTITFSFHYSAITDINMLLLICSGRSHLLLCTLEHPKLYQCMGE